MKGLILAGGKGTRLRPLSHTGPKQLVPIANKPVLHYIIEDLKDAGVTDIGIIVGYTPERIKHITDSCGDGSQFGVKITYIEQDAPRGLAHAVQTAKEFIGQDDFVVYLGDNLISEGITKYVKQFSNDKSDAGILVGEVDNPQRYGVAVLDEDGKLAELEEKPEQPKSNLAIIGVYFFKPSIFDVIPHVKRGKGGEFQLTDTIKLLLADKTVSTYVVNGWWDDTGTAEAVLRANQLTLEKLDHKVEGEVAQGAAINGDVTVGQGTTVADGAQITGPVIIGKNCTIESKCVIGPSTSIGDNTIIKQCNMQSTIIVGDCLIDCDKKIERSLIGKNVQVLSAKEGEGHQVVLGEHSKVIL